MHKLASGLVTLVGGLALTTTASAANLSDVLDVKRYVIDNGEVEVYHGWRHHRLLVKGVQIGYQNPKADILLATGAIEGTGLWIVVSENQESNLAKDTHMRDGIDTNTILNGKPRYAGFEEYETNPRQTLRSAIYDLRKHKAKGTQYQQIYDKIIQGILLHLKR